MYGAPTGCSVIQSGRCATGLPKDGLLHMMRRVSFPTHRFVCLSGGRIGYLELAMPCKKTARVARNREHRPCAICHHPSEPAAGCQ